jgi:hypothetical protein
MENWNRLYIMIYMPIVKQRLSKHVSVDIDSCKPTCRSVIDSSLDMKFKDVFSVERPSIFIRDKPIFSSEWMLHKNYYRKSSVGKKSGRESQEACRQVELIGGKHSVVK